MGALCRDLAVDLGMKGRSGTFLCWTKAPEDVQTSRRRDLHAESPGHEMKALITSI